MENQSVSAVTTSLFAQALARLGMQAGIFSLSPQNGLVSLKKDGDEIQTFPAPVKMGTVLYFIQRLAAQSSLNTLPEAISIGPYVFEPLKSRLLKDRDGRQLTDKERDILAALFMAEGYALSREELLKQVWAYADGVETHTLETHIYRLRQKMEDDPANPRWLVNSDGMYRLNP